MLQPPHTLRNKIDECINMLAQLHGHGLEVSPPAQPDLEEALEEATSDWHPSFIDASFNPDAMPKRVGSMEALGLHLAAHKEGAAVQQGKLAKECKRMKKRMIDASRPTLMVTEGGQRQCGKGGKAGQRQCGKGGKGVGDGSDKGGQCQSIPGIVNKPEASTGKQIAVSNLASNVNNEMRRGTFIAVSNLASNVTSEILRGTFEQIGTVQDAEVFYNQDGRSKCVGAVAFTSENDAQDAICRLDGVQLASRPMVVRMEEVDAEEMASQKRNKLAYFLFLAAFRSQFEAQNPDLPGLGESEEWREKGIIEGREKWSTMSAEEKAPYYTQHDHAIKHKENRQSGTHGKQIAVYNLASNVTSEILRRTFKQVGTLQDAEVFHHKCGRSMGWGAVAFTTEKDAQDAICRFHGVELASRPMVVRMEEVDAEEMASQKRNRLTYFGFLAAFRAKYFAENPENVELTEGTEVPRAIVQQLQQLKMSAKEKWSTMSAEEKAPYYTQHDEATKYKERCAELGTKFDIEAPATVLADSAPSKGEQSLDVLQAGPHANFKSKLCERFMESGSCTFGER